MKISFIVTVFAWNIVVKIFFCVKMQTFLLFFCLPVFLYVCLIDFQYIFCLSNLSIPPVLCPCFVIFRLQHKKNVVTDRNVLVFFCSYCSLILLSPYLKGTVFLYPVLHLIFTFSVSVCLSVVLFLCLCNSLSQCGYICMTVWVFVSWSDCLSVAVLSLFLSKLILSLNLAFICPISN